MAFNIASLQLSPTADLHLKHPVSGELLYDTEGLAADDESRPVVIHMNGKASKPFKKAIDALRSKQEKRGKRNATPVEAARDNVEFLLALTIGIDGMGIETTEEIDALYSNAGYSWILEQISEFLGSVESFLQK